MKGVLPAEKECSGAVMASRKQAPRRPRPSPSDVQSVMFETATGTAAAAGRASASKQPFGKGELRELVARADEDWAPDPRKTFDPDAHVRKYNAHLESSGLRPEGGREDEPGVSVVTVENRPPWGPDVFFFIDPGSISGTGPAIAKAARS